MFDIYVYIYKPQYRILSIYNWCHIQFIRILNPSKLPVESYRVSSEVSNSSDFDCFFFSENRAVAKLECLIKHESCDDGEYFAIAKSSHSIELMMEEGEQMGYRVSPTLYIDFVM